MEAFYQTEDSRWLAEEAFLVSEAENGTNRSPDSCTEEEIIAFRLRWKDVAFVSFDGVNWTVYYLRRGPETGILSSTTFPAAKTVKP